MVRKIRLPSGGHVAAIRRDAPVVDGCVACASDRCVACICPRREALSSVYRGGNIAFMPPNRLGLLHLDGQLDRFETVSLWSFGGRTKYFQDGAQYVLREEASS